jgi:hypothetical protein
MASPVRSAGEVPSGSGSLGDLASVDLSSAVMPSPQQNEGAAEARASRQEENPPQPMGREGPTPPRGLQMRAAPAGTLRIIMKNVANRTFEMAKEDRTREQISFAALAERLGVEIRGVERLQVGDELGVPTEPAP